MGTIDTSNYVSEFTKKTLEQFGWVAGDPLMENMGEIIQQIRERTPATKKPGVMIDIDLMAPEDVALMRHSLAEAKKVKEDETKKTKLETEVAGLAPGIQDAYRAIAAATENVKIVDDRGSAPSDKPTEPMPAAEPKAPPETIPPPAPKVEISEPKKPDLSPETGLAQPDILAPEKPAFCPRCDWDMRKSYEVTVNEVDKENFLATILGGTRFKKNYSILNGKYTVIFRTLLAEENKQIHRQLVLEQRANEFFSDTEWFLKFFEYRLACSIESIIVDGKVIALISPLDELNGQALPARMDDPSLPPLTRLYTYVVKELLSAEVVRRLVGKQFREFQRLYEALEAMALEPNFW